MAMQHQVRLAVRGHAAQVLAALEPRDHHRVVVHGHHLQPVAHLVRAPAAQQRLGLLRGEEVLPLLAARYALAGVQRRHGELLLGEVVQPGAMPERHHVAQLAAGPAVELAHEVLEGGHVVVARGEDEARALQPQGSRERLVEGERLLVLPRVCSLGDGSGDDAQVDLALPEVLRQRLGHGLVEAPGECLHVLALEAAPGAEAHVGEVEDLHGLFLHGDAQHASRASTAQVASLGLQECALLGEGWRLRHVG